MGLKILHVETGMHLYGGALQVMYLLRGLQQMGVHNVLVCPQSSQIEAAASGYVGKLQALPMTGDLDWRFIFRLRKIIRAEQPDVVHLHSRRGADVLGAIAAKLERTPVVLSRRVDNPEPKWWVKLKYSLYDHVITISEEIKRILVREGVNEQKLSCVHSAVDTDLYAARCDRNRFRETFAIQKKQFVIAVVAQLIRRKGHRYLLNILPSVTQQYPNTKVLLFGQGPLEAELREQVEKLGLRQVVQFAGFRKDLPKILPCLNCVVHPAEMEGLGVSLLQASAAGVPIIASAVGGIPEIVQDGVNGYLVPAHDEQALQKALERLLQDEFTAKRMAKQGRKIAQQNFSIAAMVAGNAAVYQRLLAKPSPTAPSSPDKAL